MSLPNGEILSDAGLNLQAVFDIEDLPNEINDVLHLQCDDFPSLTQLLLIGHGGPTLWENIERSGFHSDDPVDDYTVETISRYFDEYLPGHAMHFVYPSPAPIGLRDLGMLAGWHHNSPFRVGVNSEWGPWFAYRAVVLTDTDFDITPTIEAASPCVKCPDKPCITACPAGALLGGDLNLDKCVEFRILEDSPCEDTCLARESCPVGSEHRYSDAQIYYHYGRSMDTIRNWKRN